LEEYGVDLQHIPGEANVVADALSRMSTAETKVSDLVGLLSRLPTEELFTFDEDDNFPLNLEIIAAAQTADEHLTAALHTPTPKYVSSTRDGVLLYTHRASNCIYIPASLRTSIMQWYHTTLQHPGIKRMQATIKENLYWPGLDAAVEKLVQACPVCQQYKITAVKRYGKIPLPTSDTLLPWEEVHVDMIGPWPVTYESHTNPGKTSIEKIQALTIIDKATGWPEFAATKNKSSYHISILFDGEWLCRYPRPRRVIHDNGTEFTGSEFQELLQSYGIKAVSTTVRNPKSNGVIERVHLTMGDMLRTMKFSGDDWFQDLQRTLDAVAWAIRTTVNPTIKHSPCHLAFNHDMIFRKAMAINWQHINAERNKITAASNAKENATRFAKHYAVGDTILLVLDADERRSQPKMNKPTRGPYTITAVHDNGTVTINRGNYTETINIRRIKPFYT
jgi:hypothetical protein